MAKRKRLTAFGMTDSEESRDPFLGLIPTPPVARIAAEAAAQAALDDLAAELRQARESGRMVLELPLSAVEATHLQRDRMHMDPEDMAALKASIRDRGQQMPIEVVALGNDRYGLVSGARRLAVLTELHRETGDKRFAAVKGLLRPFEAAPEAYLAMVEENEIRADLSFYERGRLACEAARLGVFASPASAVKMLFQHAPAPKRSKILSFVFLHETLGSVLRFPEAIPEKLGLALVKAVGADKVLAHRIAAELEAKAPKTAEEERAILDRALTKPADRTHNNGNSIDNVMNQGIRMTGRVGRITLAGKGVTEDLISDLSAWLESRQ